MFTKTCLICGKRFQSKAHNAKQCSPECRHKAKQIRWATLHGPRKTHHKTCMICRESFETIYAVQKYCSSECYKSARTIGKRILRKNKKPKDKIIRSKPVFRGLCSVCGADDVRVIECSECGHPVCRKCRNDSGVCKICSGVRVVPSIIAV
jgi:hypothetical protein